MVDKQKVQHEFDKARRNNSVLQLAWDYGRCLNYGDEQILQHCCVALHQHCENLLEEIKELRNA